MTQYSNMFAMGEEKGRVDLEHNFFTLNAKVADTETATLGAGHAVKISDVAGGQLPVLQADADTDEIFGIVEYNVKTDSYTAGENIKISTSGNVIVMEASAAIARGAKVAYVVTGEKVVTHTNEKTSLGRALDKAAADGDLIRVLLDIEAPFSVADLADVTLTSLADNEILKYDAASTSWVNEADATA